MDHEVGAAGFPNETKRGGEGLPVADVGLEPTDVVVNRSPAPGLGAAGETDDVESLFETIKEPTPDESGCTGDDKAGK